MIIDIAIIAQILGDQFIQEDYPECEEALAHDAEAPCCVELVEPAEQGPIIESSDLPDALAKHASMPVGSESIASATPIAPPVEESRTSYSSDGGSSCDSGDSGDSGGDDD